MTKHSAIDVPVAEEQAKEQARSLLERAANVYDFNAALRGPGMPTLNLPEALAPVEVAPVYAAPAAETSVHDHFVPVSAYVPLSWNGLVQPIDRVALADGGYVLPDGPVTGIAEEFRIVKRQLLLGARGGKGQDALPGGNRILVCSPHSGDGKTFCAVNLALSLAAEKDIEVLLIDADFAKPSVVTSLGLTDGPGLMDALADPFVRLEDCVIRTDIPTLAVLPAGRQTNNDSEYVASARTAQLLDALTLGNPNRIILFDSPPLLAASPAAVLAAHVGQALMVVRADRTSESALRDAASMLDACAHVQLLLNGVKFSASGRRFGNYYGKGES